MLCGHRFGHVQFCEGTFDRQVAVGKSKHHAAHRSGGVHDLVRDCARSKNRGMYSSSDGTKARFDPAVMASPFITTIVDALALLVYFQIATIVLL